MVFPGGSFIQFFSSFSSVFAFAFVLIFFSPVIGQYHAHALERAREVKMLSDGRGEVRKIFYDFNLDRSDETTDKFSMGETKIEVTYSSGGCGEDDDADEIWNVPAGRVVSLEIVDYHEWERLALKIDLSKLEKEQMYAGDATRFIFHSKKDGVAVEIDEDEVKRLFLFPSINSKAKVCRNDLARDFIREKSWFGKVKLEDRGMISCPAASVTVLELSHLEVSAVTRKQIDVTTTAVDPENDVLIYVYTVSGGKIVGKGSKVIWDLAGMASGSYTITAGVDDGCGLCGATVTKAVVVR